MKVFQASEYAADPALRPRLTVRYSGGGSNQAPTVHLTSPATGAALAVGGGATLTASAADADGAIAQVAFFADGVPLGVDTAAPYTLTWSPGATGSVALTAVATDNLGATTRSAPVLVTVTPAAGGTAVVLQRGSDGYAGVSDTFLDRYLPDTVRGALEGAYLDPVNYVPLVRFAIFQAEGGPVPDGALIQAATLELYKLHYDDTYRVHALLRRWDEGQATWMQRQAGVAWSVPGAGGAGADYAAAADAQVVGGYAPGWLSFDVTGRVQQWAGAGSANYGWRVVQAGLGSSMKVFQASEYAADPALRPRLTVRYR
jgi:hypothetical protein